MKIFHIVPDVSYEANGVTPVINGLAAFAAENGDHVSICAIGAKITDLRIEFLQAARPSLLHLNEYSPDFSKFLKLGFKEYDIVHCHSLWSSANLSAGIHAKNKRAKMILSPHGTLSEHALSRRKIIKKMLWPLQKLALLRADLLHATAESEVLDIRRTGYRGPIALIPNGVEIPLRCRSDNNKRKKQLLFVGRIHPIKGLENLLHAWASISKIHVEWELLIAGVGTTEYEKSLNDLSTSLRLKRVKWVGPVYGSDKAKLYQESSLFILPSYSENFGMVVAEALSYGLPCVVTKGAPWSVLEEEQAGWWIDNSVDSIIFTLDRALALSFEELSIMGLHGRSYVEQNYSWSQIGRCFNDTYNWLLGNGQRPTFVIV